MAVSGTNTFNVTRNDIIKATLRLLQVIGVGETPITEDYTNCSEALNIMIKSWAKKGYPLWVTEELAITMVDGISTYPLGPTGGYLTTTSVTITDGGSGGTDGTYALTITDSGSGSGATGTYTITDGVVSSVSITAGGSGYNTVTLAFPGGGISGVTYTVDVVGKTMSKPLRLTDAYIRDSSGNDTSLTAISREEYDILGNKTNAGTPNQFYYDNQLINGQLYVFNVPEDNTHTIYCTIQRQFYDMSTSTDDFDFPKEWFQALKWGLAAELLAEYGIPLEMIPYYEQKAQMYIDECFNWSVEDTPVYFTYSDRG